jgi:hypothetical protein
MLERDFLHLFTKDAQEFKRRNAPIALPMPRDIKAYDANPRFCPKLDSKPIGTKAQPGISLGNCINKEHQEKRTFF